MINPFYSIIIPCYNCEHFISKCINSILSQNYSNYEIIVINNCSTDNTISIVKSFKSKKIKIFDCNIKGVSNARNMGIEKSTGDYCIFVDSDDFLSPGAFELINGYLNDNLPDIIYFNYYKYNDKKICISNDISCNMILNKRQMLDSLIVDIINTSFWASVWRSVIKKSFLIDNNIKFNEKVIIAEDLLFNIDLLSKCEICLLSKDSYYNYYFNRKSTLNSYKKDYLSSNSYLHSILKKKLNLNDSGLFNAYSFNRVIMYTSSISNAVRSRKYKIFKHDINIVYNEFIDDTYLKKIKLNSFLKRITFMLLKKRLFILLFILYSLKEFFRKL